MQLHPVLTRLFYLRYEDLSLLKSNIQLDEGDRFMKQRKVMCFR